MDPVGEPAPLGAWTLSTDRPLHIAHVLDASPTATLRLARSVVCGQTYLKAWSIPMYLPGSVVSPSWIGSTVSGRTART
jgi:hypothetical protein